MQRLKAFEDMKTSMKAFFNSSNGRTSWKEQRLRGTMEMRIKKIENQLRKLNTYSHALEFPTLQSTAMISSLTLEALQKYLRSHNFGESFIFRPG